MGERLAGGNVALALLANSIATGGVLVALIAAFAPISGAHMNPLVTVVDAALGGRPWKDVGPYVAAQVTGALAGVALADSMFSLAPFAASGHVRYGLPLWLSEIVATFGLLVVIWGCARSNHRLVPFAVGAYIAGAYWFTSSTSFANPAVTVARSLTNTFTGIRPADVAPFIAAQIVGAGLAFAFLRWALPRNAMQNVLFVCIHNSARSQMAEAFVNRLCAGRLRASSAGLEKGTLNPNVVKAMSELGYDLSNNETKSVSHPSVAERSYDYVITVCDEASGELCPIVPAKGQRLHWSFEDPSTFAGSPEAVLNEVRGVRDRIRLRIEQWCERACAPS